MNTLSQIVILLLIHSGSCLINNAYDFYHDYVVALGRNHVTNHFDSRNTLLSSIDHMARIINNSNSDDSNNYVGCIHYDKSTLLINKTKGYDVTIHTTYSSLRDDRYCFVTTISMHQHSLITEDIDFNLLFLKPISNMLKMDHSILKVLEWLHSFNDVLTDEQITSLENSHPIIKNIKDNKNIEISMIYRDIDLKRKQNETGHYLINDLLTSLSTTEKKNRFLEESFWTRTSSHEGKMQKLWGKFREHMNCDSKLFEVYHHNKNIRVKMSKVFLQDYKNQYNAIAKCLCFATLVIASDHAISRVAFDRPLHLLNNNAKMITQSASPLSTSEFESYSLNGLNQIIGICDTGIDMNSCFFRDEINGHTIPSSIEKPKTYLHYRKIVQYINYSGSDGDMADGHGSHVSGSAAGNCIASDSTYNSNNIYNGMAPASKIAFFDIGVNNNEHDLKIPFYLEDIYAATYSSGARIHSNSWGGGSWYDEYALETDKFLYEHSDFILLFAAGNDGFQGLRTVLTPGLTKNAVSVGGSENNHDTTNDINSVATFSAQGPTPDGRIKPDIVAPSSYIISVASASENADYMTCNTERKSGTSMASPIAAGNAALIRQYLQGSSFWGAFCHPSYSLCTGFGINPSGALIKAMLIHSTVPMNTYGHTKITGPPDMQQGYGRINLNTLLPLKPFAATGSTLFIDEQSLPSFSELIYNVTVSDIAHPFKVTISWYDPPNTEFAAKFLLHDLDLIVIDPHGQSFYGNAGISLDGHKSLGAQRDELNNNEQVWIDVNNPPKVGVYRVHVQSKLLTETKTQNFSIVITAGGLVTEPTKITSLNSSYFHECAFGGLISSPPKTEIEIAKFIVADKSKTSFGYYTISENNNSLFQGSFNGNYEFEYDKVCMHKGCYQIDLYGHSVGSQLVVPECNVYLAPTYKTQKFCIDEYYDNYQTQKFSCKSECLTDSHILLPLILVDLVGESWKGIYYSIELMNNSIQRDLSKGQITVPVAVGSLQWGYEEIRKACLPASNATLLKDLIRSKSDDMCYIMEMIVPSVLPEVQPFIAFDNVLSSMDSDGHFKVTNECPYLLNLNLTISTICINEKLLIGNVTFFANNLLNAFENIADLNRMSVLGSCTFKVEFDAGVMMNSLIPTSQFNSLSPTVLPSNHPAISPSTISPSSSSLNSMAPTTPSLSLTPSPSLMLLQNGTNQNIDSQIKNTNATATEVILSLGLEALFLMLIFLIARKVYQTYNKINRHDMLPRIQNKVVTNADSENSTNNDIEKVISPLNYNYEMISTKQDDDEIQDISNDKITEVNEITDNPLHSFNN